ncbi:MAG TPA: ribbon-helix-helix protein, CopG family [Rhizomicrobium sp.]|jgi:metal-responsive CopG/Arc/MetJ family transcriptional regulator|nr:ribbon-helix-helix protein, CopG family [Rhizomicrobium sp.]
MRTLIDIPDRMAEALTEIGARRKRSRASVVREALSEYLSRHGAGDTNAAFGLWGERGRDGLAWQRKIRAEW